METMVEAWAEMRVEVVMAWPRRHLARQLVLDEGACVADALTAARPLMPELLKDNAACVLAIYGQRAELNTPLQDGDRVEVLRPLQIDPKQARRRRAAKT